MSENAVAEIAKLAASIAKASPIPSMDVEKLAITAPARVGPTNAESWVVPMITAFPAWR